MKENEYKEKRRYTWCASKEKNTNAAWAVAGKSGHDSVYHYTLTTAFSQRRLFRELVVNPRTFFGFYYKDWGTRGDLRFVPITHIQVSNPGNQIELP
ncbi:hypothetical protein JHK87_009505 [Glycine soja]|nr:hypothetical protein JHK87_009505 [Glycine soja]